MGMTTIQALETPTVRRLAGLAQATLDYWVRTGLVTPSVRGSSGRRVTRLWSVDDVLVVRSVKALRDSGCPLRHVRRVKALLDQRRGEGLKDYVLFWDGGDVLGVDRWGNLQSLLRKPSQQMLHVVAVPLENWRREAEAVVIDVKSADTRARPPTSTRTQQRTG